MKRIVATFALALFLATPAAEARRLPVDGGTVTSGIGWRVDPFGSGRMVYHRGVDIAVPEGTPVYPTQVGTVLFAGVYKGYGYLVAVDHGNGYVTLYGHNASLLVTEGDRVDQKTVIALSGNTGRSTGPHVHYEVREIPGYAKRRQEARAQVEARLRDLVAEQVDSWVEGHLQGQGGEQAQPPVELALPAEEDP